MTSSEKKTDGPTSFSAWRRTAWKSPWRPPSIHSSSRLYAFSTSTIAPSTSTPIEIAMPASDMTFEVRPRKYIGTKASSTETGMVMIGTMADGMCHRKSRMTALTITISSPSACRSVSMARRIRRERS